MIEIKDTCYKGTRILLGSKKRATIDSMIFILKSVGMQEIQMPCIQFQETFSGKVGEENNNLMFNFTDRADRKICLAPEYTAVIQKLAKTHFKDQKDVGVFYVAECFRGEKPQAGRYRQFTQFGVEIINPTLDYSAYLLKLACELIEIADVKYCDYVINSDVTRGLDYYKNGRGFEISIPSLGSSKQVCGGGEYEGGVGFAIGIDRLLNLK